MDLGHGGPIILDRPPFQSIRRVVCLKRRWIRATGGPSAQPDPPPEPWKSGLPQASVDMGHGGPVMDIKSEPTALWAQDPLLPLLWPLLLAANHALLVMGAFAKSL